ncbi:hypothetical protein [Elioraea rosea]|uniref:hypothetical protein n=1 Tax=Elioraea rosea TaxID=2492390 RepID=UPI001186F17F|nr:hypothetical protein [Elioraea rosea]
MTSRALAMLALCLGLVAMPPDTPASGQVQSGTVGAEVIRRMLVGPGVWLLNWPDTTINFMTSNATLTFEMRGPALVVKIENHRANVSCEKEVTVTPGSIVFDGCLERGIDLRWTPDDPVFAFRGQSSLRWFTLRPN